MKREDTLLLKIHNFLELWNRMNRMAKEIKKEVDAKRAGLKVGCTGHCARKGENNELVKEDMEMASKRHRRKRRGLKGFSGR